MEMRFVNLILFALSNFTKITIAISLGKIFVIGDK